MLSSLVLAADVSISQHEKNSVVIVELNNPISYTLDIKNNGDTDTFEIYTFAGFTIDHPEKFEIDKGQTKTINLMAHATQHTLDSTRGNFVIEYQIIPENGDISKDKLRVSILELKNLIEPQIKSFSPHDQETKITLQNTENYDINNANIKISSDFFEIEKQISIPSKSQIEFSVPLNKNLSKNLAAGKYDATIQLTLEDKKTIFQTQIDYLEGEGLSVSEDKSGIIIREKTINKENEGNTKITATTTQKVNILSRLFTTFSEKPSLATKKGLFVEYTWKKALSPGEALNIKITTNYTIPFVIIIVVVLIVLGVKIYLDSNVIVKKRVSFVKTKGTELALRVKLSVKARKHVDNVELIDKIPRIAKIYDKFGIKPDKADPKTRRLFWNIKSLNAGEERVFSYIIYSKIKVVGKFELPAATVTYEKEGKKQESSSNKTYFAAESSHEKPEEF